MHGKSVSPLAFSGKPQFMRWYQQFHSGTRCGVHRADEVAHAQRGRHADLLRADAVHLRDVQVRQLVDRALVLCASSAALTSPSPLASTAANGSGSGHHPAFASALLMRPSPFGVERGEQPLRRLLRVHAQPVRGVRVAGHRPLVLRPLHQRRRPRRPALRLRPFGAGVGLVAEVEQADVPERLRAEPAHLHVVLEDGERLALLPRRRPRRTSAGSRSTAPTSGSSRRSAPRPSRAGTCLPGSTPSVGFV